MKNGRTRRRAPTGHKLFNHDSTFFSVAPVGGHLTFVEIMKRIIPLIKLFTFTLLLNCCAENSEVKLWNRFLSDEKKIPVLTKTTGKITFQESKHSVVAKIVCPDWPWYEMKVTWPDGAPRIGQADMEVMEEKWMG